MKRVSCVEQAQKDRNYTMKYTKSQSPRAHSTTSNLTALEASSGIAIAFGSWMSIRIGSFRSYSPISSLCQVGLSHKPRVVAYRKLPKPPVPTQSRPVPAIVPQPVLLAHLQMPFPATPLIEIQPHLPTHALSGRKLDIAGEARDLDVRAESAAGVSSSAHTWSRSMVR